MYLVLNRILGWLQQTGRLRAGAQLATVLLAVVPKRWASVWCLLKRRRGFLSFLQGKYQAFLVDVGDAEHVAVLRSRHGDAATCIGLRAIHADQVQDDPDRALTLNTMALQFAERAGDRELQAKLLVNRGAFLRKLKRFSEADSAFAGAMVSPDPRVRLNVRLERAKMHRVAGHLGAADALLETALLDATQLGYPNEIGDILRERARVARDLKNMPAARRFANQALLLFRAHGYHDKAAKLEDEMVEVLQTDS